MLGWRLRQLGPQFLHRNSSLSLLPCALFFICFFFHFLLLINRSRQTKQTKTSGGWYKTLQRSNSFCKSRGVFFFLHLFEQQNEDSSIAANVTMHQLDWVIILRVPRSGSPMLAHCIHHGPQLELRLLRIATLIRWWAQPSLKKSVNRYFCNCLLLRWIMCKTKQLFISIPFQVSYWNRKRHWSYRRFWSQFVPPKNKDVKEDVFCFFSCISPVFRS